MSIQDEIGFVCCRAGLLKTLGANKNAPLPVRLFEISDVVLLSEAAETGARNERRLAAAVCAKESTFETIHGFLNRVMDVLGVPAHVPGLGEPTSCLPCHALQPLATPMTCRTWLVCSHNDGEGANAAHRTSKYANSR